MCVQICVHVRNVCSSIYVFKDVWVRVCVFICVKGSVCVFQPRGVRVCAYAAGAPICKLVCREGVLYIQGYMYTPTCTFMPLVAASQFPAKPNWDLQPSISSRLLDGSFHSHMVV